jgi:hypothetical protein
VGAGDEIVVTELDHHANSDTWRQLARDRGSWSRPSPSGARPASSRWRRCARRSAQGRGSSRSARRRTRSARSTTCAGPRTRSRRRVPSSSWTPSTTRRTRSWTCGSSARLPGLLGLQVLRPARRRAVGTPGSGGRARPAAARAAPSTSPENLETGTQNHEGSSARRRRSTSCFARLRLRPALPARGRVRSAPRARPGARRAAVDGLRGIEGVTVYGPCARLAANARPSPSASAAWRPSPWRERSPSAPSSSRTATSTPRRWSRGSATRGRRRARRLRLLYERGRGRALARWRSRARVRRCGL